MKAKEIIRILSEDPELEVVTSPPREYDDYGDISNYSEDRVLKSDMCWKTNGVIFISFDEEKLDIEEVRR